MNTDQCPGANVCCSPSWCKTTGKCLHQQPGQQPRSAVDRTLDCGGVLMNRDEIIRMAREAGFETAQDWALFPSGFVVVVERFATLVATFVADRMIRNGYRKCAEGQRETQFCGQLESAVAGAIATEREACAKVCDEIAQRDETGYGVAEDCADAIRARNKG